MSLKLHTPQTTNTIPRRMVFVVIWSVMLLCLIQHAPIGQVAQGFETEGTGPGNKPIVETRFAVGVLPVTVEECLVLASYGAYTTIHFECAVRHPLTAITPHGQRFVAPDVVAREFGQTQPLPYPQQCINVQMVVLYRHGGCSKGAEIIVPYLVVGIWCVVVLQPGGKVVRNAFGIV